MRIRLLTGAAACAALTVLCAPVSAATTPGVAAAAVTLGGPSDDSVSRFYARRQGQLLWLEQGADSGAARALISILNRSSLDGLASGPALAAQAEQLLARARGGDKSALDSADRLLSTGWARYVQALRRPPNGMTYASDWLIPRTPPTEEVLALAASAPSLEAHMRSVAAVNPLYAQLRDAAWQQMQASGSADPRLLSSLDRARALPAKGRSVVVDAASARLWMVEDGRIADSMKVIVGKPSSQTPMLASTIYYATLNPYWNVPPDLVQKLIAPRVLSQGFGYLKSHGYQILSGPGGDAQPVAPKDVDWKAVAAGSETLRVRQLPGPGNSMGRLKFGFANDSAIFLHDTPQKDLFAADSRSLSNGCIRLEDAERLGRWLMGREPATASSEPEQQVALPKPVPVYVTYLTAHADSGQLSFVDDVYGKDVRAAQMAALR